MDRTATPGPTPSPNAGNAPDNLIKNPLDTDESAGGAGRDSPRTDQAHDPGPGLLTNPLDKPGARDNLIKNPLDKD